MVHTRGFFNVNKTSKSQSHFLYPLSCAIHFYLMMLSKNGLSAQMPGKVTANGCCQNPASPSKLVFTFVIYSVSYYYGDGTSERRRNCKRWRDLGVANLYHPFLNPITPTAFIWSGLEILALSYLHVFLLCLSPSPPFSFIRHPTRHLPTSLLRL